eukprot:scaffold64336_cov58-Phaeocystis_antarctica.AAC.2
MSAWLISHDSRNGVFPAVLSALSKESDGGAHVVGGGRRRCEGPHCEALLVRGGSGQGGEHGCDGRLGGFRERSAWAPGFTRDGDDTERAPTRRGGRPV